jgi:ABC-type branched-subunit amino acid transport system substrate-binding protein
MGRKRALAVVVCIGLVAAACSRSDDGSEGSEPTNDSTTATTAAKGGAVDFGTLQNVCQPGDAKGATAQGVTDDSIRIATFSDPGFAGRPGLNQELFDSAEVFAAWCNDAGGINGREIIVDKKDAALTNYQARMVEACQDDFLMVGGGAVFDNTGVEERLTCMLLDIAGYAVTPQARGADLLIQPLPNKPGYISIGDYQWLAKEYPDSKKHVGILTGDIQTTVKVGRDDREYLEKNGFEIVYNETFPAVGVATWTPYVQAIKDRGVKGLVWVGEPEGLAKFVTELRNAGVTLDWIRTPPNHYDPSVIDIAGPALDNVYIWSGFPLFEEAEDNPAIQQYLDLFAEYKPNAKTKALLGLQAWSAWLLFAQLARDCGSDLTRRCIYDKAQEVHEWTGGGLHAASDPGNNTGSGCYLLVEATPDGFERVKIDTNDGVFNCGEKNTYFVKEGSDEGVKLEDVGKTLDDL